MRFTSVTVAAMMAVGCGARTQLGVPNPLPRDATTADVSVVADTSLPEATVDAAIDSVEAAIDCGVADAAVAGDPTWLHDECLFEPLPSLASCDVHQAILPSPRFPVRTWSSCGEGCRVAEADLAGAGEALAKFAWVDGERVYIPLTYSDYVEGKAPATAVIQEIWEASEGRTMVAIETRNFASDGFSQCVFTDMTAHTGPVGIFEWWHHDGDFPTGDGETVFYAVSRYRERSTVDVLAGSLHLSPSELGPARDVATDTWWAQELGSLRATNDFHHLPPHPSVAAASGIIEDLQTDGEAFYWITIAEGAVHRWSKDGGDILLHDRSPRSVWSLAASKSSTTWVESADASSGTPPHDIALVHAAKGAAPRVVSALETVTLELAINGVRAAFGQGDVKHPRLHVVTLADGGTVKLASPPARYWARVLGMTPSTLYVGAQKTPERSATLSWIYALDLAKLDALAKAWPP